MSEMGLFTVHATLRGPTGRSEDVEMLVDTGSHYLMIPEDVAQRLELVPTDVLLVQLAGGSRAEWSLAEVRLKLDAREIRTDCLILPAGRAILGALPLEQLYLMVDPVKNQLVPGSLIRKGTIVGRRL